METPYFNYSLFKDNFLNVYEPAEDSFLLLDAIQLDLKTIKDIKPTFFMEIGSGSGILITSLAKHFTDGYFLSTDINEYACETTLKCASSNNIPNKIESINTNLSLFLNERLKNQIDILVFNPPYVPSNDDKIKSNSLDKAWAGGLNGRKIIDKFINSCLDLISKNGLLYLLVIKENNPEEVIKLINSKGFQSSIIIERKNKNELQYVIKSRKI